jgi:O-antigen/teichoic acid export membrane protein
MSVKNSVFYNVLLAISQVFFPLITFPYLARTLGPEHVGVLNFAESIAKYFVMLAALGIPIYGIREIAKVQNELKARTKIFAEIFTINLICTLGLSLLFLGAVFFIPQLNNEKVLFYWTIAYFFFQVFYLEWFFNGMNQFKFIAIRQFVIRFFFIIFVFVLIKSQLDYVNYMRMQFGLSVLLAIINFNNLSKHISLNKETFSNLDLRKHIKPLLYIFLTIFSISIYFSLDTILLGFLANNESVGYYSTALKLNKLIIAVFGAVTVAIFPSLINLYHSQQIEKFRELIRQVFFVLVSLSIPAFVIFIFCAKEIVHVLFSQNFDRSILPLQITAPLILIVSLSSIFGFQVLSALAKDRQILYSAIIGMSVSVVLSILLVPSLMEVGEAITILVTELSVSVSFIYFTKKYFKVGGLTNMFLKQLVGALPYIVFVIIFKSIIADSVIVLTSISIISLIWFCIYHLFVLQNSYFKIYLNNFIEKLQA